MHKDFPYQEEREFMVSNQIERRGIREPRLLGVLRKVPRHLFVPDSMQDLAYGDGPLPIENGQTISQPFIVALMTDALELKGNEKVLEIGTGSGYQAAILAYMASFVHSVERLESLARSATMVLTQLGLKNVMIHFRDGSVGLPNFAPYDAIMITAAAPIVHEDVLKQLSDGGRLIAPVGGQGRQILKLWRREGNTFSIRKLIPVAFVPLRGVHGWKSSEW